MLLENFHKKLVYKDESKTVNEEELSEWEKSYEDADILRAARAYYYGNGADQNLEKAFGLLKRIEYVTAAKYLLALCYLYGKGTVVDTKMAVKLLEE